MRLKLSRYTPSKTVNIVRINDSRIMILKRINEKNGNYIERGATNGKGANELVR